MGASGRLGPGRLFFSGRRKPLWLSDSGASKKQWAPAGKLSLWPPAA